MLLLRAVYGAVEVGDAFLVLGDELVGRRHPQMCFDVTRLGSVRIYEEEAKVLSSKTGNVRLEVIEVWRRHVLFSLEFYLWLRSSSWCVVGCW